MKERFSSRPPFVYFFNPDIEYYGYCRCGCYYEGFFSKIGQIGAGKYIDDHGEMYMGYFKNDKYHLYGRGYVYFAFKRIDDDHNIYEGGFKQHREWGRGETEYYKDGSRETGLWIEGRKRGDFEYIYKDGTVATKSFPKYISDSDSSKESDEDEKEDE